MDAQLGSDEVDGVAFRRADQIRVAHAVVLTTRVAGLAVVPAEYRIAGLAGVMPAQAILAGGEVHLLVGNATFGAGEVRKQIVRGLRLFDGGLDGQLEFLGFRVAVSIGNGGSERHLGVGFLTSNDTSCDVTICRIGNDLCVAGFPRNRGTVNRALGRKCDVGIHISAAVVNGQRISVGLGGIGLRGIVGFLDLVSSMRRAVNLEVVKCAGIVFAIHPVGLADLQHAAVCAENIGELSEARAISWGYGCGLLTVNVQRGSGLVDDQIDVTPLAGETILAHIAGGVALTSVVVTLNVHRSGAIHHAEVMLLLIGLRIRIRCRKYRPALIGAGGLGIVRNRDRIQALEHGRIVRLSHIQPESRTELSCGSAVFTGSYCGGTVDGCLGAGCLIGEGTSGTCRDVVEVKAGKQITVCRCLGI